MRNRVFFIWENGEVLRPTLFGCIERGGKWRHLQADIILYMHNKMYVKVTVGKIFIESVER